MTLHNHIHYIHLSSLCCHINKCNATIQTLWGVEKLHAVTADVFLFYDSVI